VIALRISELAEQTGVTVNALRYYEELARRRDVVVGRLEAASARVASADQSAPSDLTALPSDLPAPVDDGSAGHLVGMRVPAITLRSSDGGRLDLAARRGRTIVYAYPLTGRPGHDLPDGWDAIPGARGCTTEACDFRDHFAELAAAGVSGLWGLSSQDIDYQAEVVDRLRLPFSMLSDEDFALADALNLPTFAAPGHPRLHRRITLVLQDDRIEHVFYPVFPPNTHGREVLEWVLTHP
jgi:peroxiredoxin